MSALAMVTPLFLSAAPSLDVRKPPVLSGINPNTGPGVNPTASAGQWFRTASSLEFRTHEFYDNRSGLGGGARSTNAIFGAVSSIMFGPGPGGAILSFSIKATISNDTAATSGVWLAGRNSHGEQRPFSPPFYRGTLIRPFIVSEFALNNQGFFPAGPIAGTPDTASPGPRIIAANHDAVGWYCFTGAFVPGNFFVPAWQLPSIPVAASVTIVMSFRVADGGITPADPRYSVLVNSLRLGTDILSNRTTSLKISNWVEGLWADTGVPYFPVGQSSNVSVFHGI